MFFFFSFPFFFLHINYGTSFFSFLISIYIGLNDFILSIYIYSTGRTSPVILLSGCFQEFNYHGYKMIVTNDLSLATSCSDNEVM